VKWMDGIKEDGLEINIIIGLGVVVKNDMIEK
jgi:hypothetical protein